MLVSVNHEDCMRRTWSAALQEAALAVTTGKKMRTFDEWLAEEQLGDPELRIMVKG